ncbi:DedA family protein [Speluncibacter jeojiensis]|uniref:DedA family protein n=1 Tax=Speluncibacter jeojiensis TaxID=2710754 RepID=A0A9X4RI02_9ACTN|nr:DedA family protein [Corynebacteriales bacterium D3-21]
MGLAADGFGPLQSAGPVMVWLIVLVFVFLECAVIVGLFLPGDSLLITAGVVLAAHGSEAQVWLLAVGAMTAAIVGNQVGYHLGHKHGHRVIARRSGRCLNAKNLHRCSQVMERHGFWGVLIARWIPFVRTLCPLVAGAAHMNRRTFTIASSIGAVFWAPVIPLIGYYGGGQLGKVPWLMPAVTAALVVALIAGTAIGLRHYRQEMAKPPETVEI